MKIKRIEFMEEITDVYNDNIDVLVENEDGYNYIISVGTPQNLLEEMNQEKANFVRPGTPKIIVKKLTKEIVTKAIEAYAEDTGYWLKLHQFANSIDISIFNKLEAEHRKEWEGWEED
jgi:division protein CdvB (Snf7/Vps24/ESCRT-III family)